MGVMTRLEMQTEVLDRLNRTTTDMASMVDTWLYRAVLDLCSYKKFFDNEKSATMTQSAGAATATWPTDLWNPQRLEWSDGSVMFNCRVKDLVYVRELYHSGSTGRPDFVARHGATAYFDRIADQDYAWTVYYLYEPADFANDAATSIIGAEWDEALILWAVAEGYGRLRQWDLYEFHKKLYYSYVAGRLGDVDAMEENYNESLAGDIDDDPFTF
jgi:hypothetical protein